MGDFKHKHSLGQNFLKDKNVLAKIIDSCDVKEDDLVSIIARINLRNDVYQAIIDAITVINNNDHN